MRFGRIRPVAQAPRLRLSRYLVAHVLPPGPAACDYSPEAAACLENILGNDELGDCVIAGGYHVTGVATANAGSLFTPTMAEVLADYGKIGGYIPGDPSTDQGCDETTALDYWTHTGFANGTRLLGYLAVDATNKLEVQSACFLFENLFFGLELPDAWVSPLPSATGFVWDVAGDPDPDNGHCVIGTGYGPAGVTIATWGMLGTMTYAAISKYCAARANGALYVMFTPDQLSKAAAKAPNGVAWSELVTDFDAIGGHVAPVIVPPSPAPAPSPAPSPPPPPTPTPPVRVTLAQAKEWASEGLALGWPKP